MRNGDETQLTRGQISSRLSSTLKVIRPFLPKIDLSRGAEFFAATPNRRFIL